MTLAKHYRKKPVPKLRKFSGLNDDGTEKLNPKPLAIPLSPRPTLNERVRRIEAHSRAMDMYFDEEFDPNDYQSGAWGKEYDFHDLPDEGLTPYELAEMPKPKKKKLDKKKSQASSPDLSPETGDKSAPAPSAPQTAGEGSGAATEGSNPKE